MENDAVTYFALILKNTLQILSDLPIFKGWLENVCISYNFITKEPTLIEISGICH
jgi:hypothetical protein